MNKNILIIIISIMASLTTINMIFTYRLNTRLDKIMSQLGTNTVKEDDEVKDDKVKDDDVKEDDVKEDFEDIIHVENNKELLRELDVLNKEEKSILKSPIRTFFKNMYTKPQPHLSKITEVVDHEQHQQKQPRSGKINKIDEQQQPQPQQQPQQPQQPQPQQPQQPQLYSNKKNIVDTQWLNDES